jgi:hypothetical protein
LAYSLGDVGAIRTLRDPFKSLSTFIPQPSFVHVNVLPSLMPMAPHALHRFDVPLASTISTAMPARRASRVARSWTSEKNQ